MWFIFIFSGVNYNAKDIELIRLALVLRIIMLTESRPRCVAPRISQI